MQLKATFVLINSDIIVDKYTIKKFREVFLAPAIIFVFIWADDPLEYLFTSVGTLKRTAG